MSEWMLNVKNIRVIHRWASNSMATSLEFATLGAIFKSSDSAKIKEVVFRHDKTWINGYQWISVSVYSTYIMIIVSKKWLKKLENLPEHDIIATSPATSLEIPLIVSGLVFRLCRSAQTRPFGGPWCWGRCNPAWLYPQPGNATEPDDMIHDHPFSLTMQGCRIFAIFWDDPPSASFINIKPEPGGSGMNSPVNSLAYISWVSSGGRFGGVWTVHQRRSKNLPKEKKMWKNFNLTAVLVFENSVDPRMSRCAKCK